MITGYYARLSPTKLDAGLVVFVQVTLQRTAGDAFKTFTDAIELIPEVEECHLVSGEFDFLVKARVKDMTHYKDLLAGSLLQFPTCRNPRAIQSWNLWFSDQVSGYEAPRLATTVLLTFCFPPPLARENHPKNILCWIY